VDIKKLMAEAQKMQSSLKEKIEEYDGKVFTHKFKDLITIEIYGSLLIKSVKINDLSLLDEKDPSMLEDVINEAVNIAISATLKGKEEITSAIAGPGLQGLF